MPAVGSRDSGAYAANLTGGLETAVPPTRVDPSQTPEAVNVRFSNGAVTSRGGFVPHIRQQPMASSVRNRGYHGRGHDNSADGDSVVVPGLLVAGDRAIYDGLGSSLPSVCVSFFMRIDDLSTTTLGSSGTYPGVARPVPIRVRPIISKGPVKKSAQNTVAQDKDDFGAETVARGQTCWNLTNAYGPSGDALEMTAIVTGGGFTTITTRSAHGLATNDLVRLVGTGSTGFGSVDGIDGVRVVTVTGANTFTVPVVGVAPERGTVLTKPAATGHGMPFCVYLWYDTGTATWQLRASCHVISGSNFQLKTVTSTVAMRVGARYRVIASFTYTGALRLRVGVWNSVTHDYDYVCNELTWAGTTGCKNTQAPIQVFDCPQDFVERVSTDQPTWDTTNFWSRPPGLNLDSGVGGGYFFASKRFEGAIDDIEIRKVGLSSTADTAFDRPNKLNLQTTTFDTLLNYWSGMRRGERMLIEETGRGNHLYFSPDFPVLDDASGGIRDDRKASLWFNGQTSYAMLQKGGSNVRYRNNNSSTPDYGALEQIVKSRYPFGFQVEFVLDSLAEPFEQVLAEFHTVMRCVIRPDGRLGVYYRDDHTNVGAIGRAKYVGAVVGKTVLKTGCRYSASFFWTGTALEIYLGELREITVSIALTSQTGWPVSGFTFGMGARRFTSWTADIAVPIRADADTAEVDEINTDSRSGFCGRIERVKLLVRDANASLQGSRSETVDDWRKPFTRIWRSPTAGANRDRINPLFPDAAAASFSGAGAVAVIVGDTDEQSIGYVLETVDGTNLVPLVERLPFGGHNVLEAVRVDFFSVVGLWEFDQSLGDDGIRCGRYMQSLEWRALGYSAGLILADEYRYVAEQSSEITDQVGLFPGLVMRCVQSDTLFEADGAFDIGVNPMHSTDQIVVQPWLWQSPREAAPHWDVGLALPPTGKSPISLIASWNHEASGERFTILGAHRALYWARRVWRRDTPFLPQESVARSDDGCVWAYGREGEHISCAQTDARQVLNGNIVSIDLWCRPQRVDGVRVLAAMVDTATGQVNFAVLLWNGSLVLCGTMGGNTEAWLLHEGTTPTVTTSGKTTGNLPRRRMTTNAWNHVHVILGEWSGAASSNDPQAWINGSRVELVSYDASVNGGPTADSPATDPPDSDSMRLYLGGLPAGFTTLRLGMSAGGPLVLETKSWHGMLTEYSQTDDEDPSFPAAAGSPGVVPRARKTLSSDHTYLLRLDATESWVFPNLAIGLAAGGGICELDELIPLETDLDESSFARYSAAPFRDAMFVTNGVSRPREIRFEAPFHSAPAGGFESHAIGLRQPVKHPTLTVVEPVYDSNVTEGLQSRAFLTTGVYVVAMAFRDRHFRESEPESLGTIVVNPTAQAISAWAIGPPTLITFGSPHGFQNGDKVTVIISGTGNASIDGIPMVFSATSTTQGNIPVTIGAPPATNGTAKFFPDGIRVRNLPRSVDPHAVARVFYVSPFGGGVPVKHVDELADNESPTVELYSPGDTSEAIQVQVRLVPPRGRLIAVGGGRVFLAHLTDVEARGSSFAWSDNVEVTYFPLPQLASLDSRDGQRIIGLHELLGRFYLGKRDSTWVFFDGGVGAVNESVGCAGGFTLYDNVLYGVGERGFHRFDGANTVFASDSLRGVWPTIPLTDEDLLNTFGAYVRQNSEYWASMRLAGRLFNTRIWVLSMAVGDRQVWSALDAPEHSFMESVIDALTQAPKVLIGTTSGQLLEYDEDISIDGSKDDPMPGESALVLDGAGTLSGRVITIAAGKFDTVREGFRGCPVTLTNGSVEFTTVVERNTSSTLTLRDTPPFSGAITFEVGGFEASWSSGWIHSQRDGQFLIATEIDMEFRPNPTLLTVENVAAISTRAEDGGIGTTYEPTRSFPTDGVESRQVNLVEGFQSEPVAVTQSNRGRYFRLRVRTRPLLGGIRSPWELWGIGPRWRAEGSRGGRPS